MFGIARYYKRKLSRSFSAFFLLYCIRRQSIAGCSAAGTAGSEVADAQGDRIVDKVRYEG